MVGTVNWLSAIKPCFFGIFIIELSIDCRKPGNFISFAIILLPFSANVIVVPFENRTKGKI